MKGFRQTLVCAEQAAVSVKAATDQQLFLVNVWQVGEGLRRFAPPHRLARGGRPASQTGGEVALTAGGLALLGAYVCTRHAQLAITCTTSCF